MMIKNDQAKTFSDLKHMDTIYYVFILYMLNIKSINASGKGKSIYT